MSDDEQETRRLRFKIVLIGDGAVGKTSLMQQLVHGDFKPQ